MKSLATAGITALAFLAITITVTQHAQAQLGGGGSADAKVNEVRLKTLEMKVKELSLLLSRFEKSPLADTQETVVTSFRPRFASSVAIANTIADLLGEKGYRLAADQQANQLIVSATPKVTEVISTIVSKIDVAPPHEAQPPTAESQNTAPRSLLIRTFWLADGTDKKKDPQADELLFDLLPQNVLDALRQQAGINNPWIVSHNTASLIAHIEDPVTSQFVMPAIYQGNELKFNCEAEIHLNREEYVELFSEIAIQSLFPRGRQGEDIITLNVCQLSGSITAPLGHFMILGTTNYASKGQHPLNNLGEGRPGNRELPAGGYGGSNDQPPQATHPQEATTSRFAFVIQVIEADSYPSN